MATLRYSAKILSALSIIDSASNEVGPVELGGAIEISFYIVFGPGTSAGAVQIESSPISKYTGIWAAEGSPVAWVAVNRVHKVSITGVSWYSRARISTAIVGGTVDVYAIANG